MDPEARQRRLLELTKQLVRAQSARSPGVTLWEDLHWFDPASEVFMANHVDAAQGARGLTILNFRPDYHARWMSKSYYRQIALAPLGPEAIEQLLAELLGSDPSLGGLGDLVRERTAGNPFFIEEVVRSLVEAGNLEGERGAHRLVGPVVRGGGAGERAGGPVGAGSTGSPNARRPVLQAAAVIGKEFPEPVLARVTGAGAVRRSRMRCARWWRASSSSSRSSIRSRSMRSRTRSPRRWRTARSWASAGPPSTQRSARAIVEQHPERLDERAALLAGHWESASEPLGGRALARARRRLGRDRGPDCVAAPLAQGQGAGRCPARHRGDGGARALGAHLRAELRMAAGPLRPGGRGPLHRGRAHGHRRRRTSGRGRLLLATYGTILFATRGRYREALTADPPGRRPGRRIRRLRRSAWIVASSSYTLYPPRRVLRGARLHATGPSSSLTVTPPSGPRWSPARSPSAFHAEGRDPVATSAGSTRPANSSIADCGWPPSRAPSRRLAGGTCSASPTRIGAAIAERAMIHAQESIEIAERIGDAFSRTWSWSWMGRAAVMGGEWDRAIEAIQRAQAISSERRTAADAESWSWCGLPRHIWAWVTPIGPIGPGRVTRSLCAAAASRRRPRSPRNVVLARVLLAAQGLGARDEIDAALTRAQELVDATGAHGHEPTIHVELAELAHQNGDEAERERELREAHRLFTQIGATGHAERLAGQLPTPAG